MSKIVRRSCLGAVCALGLWAGCVTAMAEPVGNIAPQSTIVLGQDASATSVLCDERYTTRLQLQAGDELSFTCPQEAAALYLQFDRTPESWQLVDETGERTCGQQQFLHQFVQLTDPQSTFTIRMDDPAVLCEVYVFPQGELPDFVQDWDAPCEKADLLVLPTHADDEHLYFGGTMPTYTDRGYAVQVAYMVQHNGEPYRPHELLNGLWTAGVRNYPIIPEFPDVYSDSLEHAKTIYDQQAILAYQVELIRRFQPLVIVGHDINGEYGHGAHQLNAATLQQAVEAAADPDLLPESAAAYGVWDTPKTYLHLWEQGEVVMDLDVPLESFGGKTAFEVAVDAFACHASQQTYFKVEQSGPYDCRKFGLYRTTVGEDVAKDDLFENIPAREEPEPPEEPSSQPESQPSSQPEPPADQPVPDGSEQAPSTRPGWPWALAGAAVAAVLLLGVALFFWKRKRD